MSFPFRFPCQESWSVEKAEPSCPDSGWVNRTLRLTQRTSKCKKDTNSKCLKPGTVKMALTLMSEFRNWSTTSNHRKGKGFFYVRNRNCWKGALSHIKKNKNLKMHRGNSPSETRNCCIHRARSRREAGNRKGTDPDVRSTTCLKKGHD